MNTKEQLNSMETNNADLWPQSPYPSLTSDPKYLKQKAKKIRQYIKKKRPLWRQSYGHVFPQLYQDVAFAGDTVHQHVSDLSADLPEGRDAQEEYFANHLVRCWKFIKAGKDLLTRDLLLALRILLVSATACNKPFVSRAILLIDGMLRDIGAPIGAEKSIWQAQELVDRWAAQDDKSLDFILALMTLAEQHRVLSQEAQDTNFVQALRRMQDVCTLVNQQLEKRRGKNPAVTKHLQLILFEALRWKFRLITKHAGEYDDPVALESLQCLRELAQELNEPFISLELSSEEVGYYLLLDEREAAQRNASELVKGLENLSSLSPYAQFFVLRTNINLHHKLKETEQAIILAQRYITLWQKFPLLYDGLALKNWWEGWLKKTAGYDPCLRVTKSQRPVFTTGVIPLLYSDLGREFLHL